MPLQPRLDDLLELRHQAHTLGLASFHLVNSSFNGLFASVFRGAGLDFDDVREYRNGDDVRNMEWKITARTGIPHLKVFREERERNVMLCVEHSAAMNFGTRGTFKSVQAARAAALLGWAANHHHDRVGGLLFGNPARPLEYVQPARGHRSLWRLLNLLGQPVSEVAGDGNDLVTALQRISHGAGTGSLIFVIASFNRDVAELERTLGSLCQRHDVVMLPVDDPADHDLPRMGAVVFTGPDGARVEVDTDDEQGQAQYREAWLKRREELQRMCNQLGVVLIPVATDSDVHQTVAEGLTRRAAARHI